MKRWLVLGFVAPGAAVMALLVGVAALGVMVAQSTTAAASPAMAPVFQFLAAQLGKPYSTTQPDGPDSWDCSGLVTGAYRTIGIVLPSLTFDQVKLGDPVAVDPSLVQPGDALFMRGGDPVVDLGHVAVAISTTQMISAPKTGDVVHISNIPWAGVQAVRRYVKLATVTADATTWDAFLAAHFETSGHIDPNDQLTSVQVTILFYNVGCRGEFLVDFVAIAGRESGFGFTAFNFHAQSTGDISLGLVQENVLGSLGGRLAQAGLSDPRQLFNPINAVRAAFILSQGCTNLSPWGSYKGLSDTYNTDLPGAIAAVSAAKFYGLIGADA